MVNPVQPTYMPSLWFCAAAGGAPWVGGSASSRGARTSHRARTYTMRRAAAPERRFNRCLTYLHAVSLVALWVQECETIRRAVVGNDHRQGTWRAAAPKRRCNRCSSRPAPHLFSAATHENGPARAPLLGRVSGHRPGRALVPAVVALPVAAHRDRPRHLRRNPRRLGPFDARGSTSRHNSR